MEAHQRIECRTLATVLVGAIVLCTSVACDVDELPPCPGQCFDFTLERSTPSSCTDEDFFEYDIAFNGTDPDGYRGRFCFNSTSVPLVAEAIEHLQAGGELSDLPMQTVSAYVSTVNAVIADVEAECILAASGQCTNAAAVCAVVGADAYEQLVIEQTCALALDGTEPIALASGQTCHAVASDSAAGSADAAYDHCADATVTATTTALDDTAGSDG
jgi:hypothetical protein